MVHSAYRVSLEFRPLVEFYSRSAERGGEIPTLALAGSIPAPGANRERISLLFVMTLNVKSNPHMSRAHVRHDLARAEPMAGVHFWQEIQPKYYNEVLKALDPRKWAHAHVPLEIPISWNNNFKEFTRGHIMTHHGRAHTSPNRYISWVGLEFNGHQAIFMNTHYVSGAWNRKHKLHKQWRKDMWEQHYRIQKNLVCGFVRDGFTVVGGGDFNRSHVEKFHADQHWVTPGPSIDKLFVVEGNGGPSLIRESLRTVSHGWFTDHPAKIGHIALK